MSFLSTYANPTRFLRFAERALPWLSGATALLLGDRALRRLHGAARLSAGRNRPDHVHPCSVRLARHLRLCRDDLGVARRSGVASSARRRRAEDRRHLGAAFTFICLVTGSLWGKPMWGTFWVWDARLTSMLVLFLLYLGLIAVQADDGRHAARRAHRGDHDARRRHRHSDHQIFGRLVEHAAPAGLGVSH